MKKIRIIMPVLAFLFAIGAAFASASTSTATITYKYKALGVCVTCNTIDQSSCQATGNNRCKCTETDPDVDAWLVDSANGNCVEAKYN